MLLPAITRLSSPQAMLLLQKNAPFAFMSTPSVFLGAAWPETASVEMVMPVTVRAVSPFTQMCSSGEFWNFRSLICTRVEFEKLTSCGRASVESVSKAVHQACPWPSIVPAPVSAISCALLAVMNGVAAP
jgi:hypothetical protein